jgi:hypothetical protein
MAIKFMKYGGLALAVYGVINELVGGEGKEETDKDSTEDKDKDEKTN